MERWFVYILFSKSLNKYYVGSTYDVEWRLERHNAGWGKYTKTGVPWVSVLCEEYSTKTEALKRESEIKNKKSRKYIEGIIIKAGGRPDEVGKPR